MSLVVAWPVVSGPVVAGSVVTSLGVAGAGLARGGLARPVASGLVLIFLAVASAGGDHVPGQPARAGHDTGRACPGPARLVPHALPPYRRLRLRRELYQYRFNR